MVRVARGPRRSIFEPLAVIAFGVFGVGSAAAQLADSPWPSYGGDARNSHVSPYLGPASTPTLQWSFPVGFQQAAFQPIITGDGGIVFGTNEVAGDRLFAINRDGSQRWSIASPGVGNWASSDVLGRVYFGTESSGGSLRAVRQDNGSVVFNRALGASAPMQSGTTVGSDGHIYLGHQEPAPRLYSYDSQGNRNWAVSGGGYNVEPVISPSGDIIVAGDAVRAYASDGTPRWEFDVDDHTFPPGTQQFFSPAVSEDGTTYVGQWATGSRTERLFALDSGGHLLWTFESAGGSPAIGPDGTIYAGQQSTLFAINPDGTEKWHFNHGPSGSSEAPTLDAAGNIYLTNAAGILYSLDSDGDVRWNFDLAPTRGDDIFPSMPVIDFNGTMYVGTGYGHTMVALIPEPTTALLGVAVILLRPRRDGIRCFEHIVEGQPARRRTD